MVMKKRKNETGRQIADHRHRKTTAANEPIVPRGRGEKRAAATTGKMAEHLRGMGLDPSAAVERARRSPSCPPLSFPLLPLREHLRGMGLDPSAAVERARRWGAPCSPLALRSRSRPRPCPPLSSRPCAPSFAQARSALARCNPTS